MKRELWPLNLVIWILVLAPFDPQQRYLSLLGFLSNINSNLGLHHLRYLAPLNPQDSRAHMGMMLTIGMFMLLF